MFIPDARPENDWWWQGRKIFNHLYSVYHRFQCSGVFVEWPAFRSSTMGQAVAARGDLLKLTYAASLALAVPMQPLFGKGGGGFAKPVDVMVWKGQLPKTVVEDRIRQRLGSEACEALEIKTHAWDAVGLGLWAKGHF